MIKFIENFIHTIKSVLLLTTTLRPLKFTRLVEKFDVVKAVPAYVRIKV
jgi:hypothetical protein